MSVENAVTGEQSILLLSLVFDLLPATSYDKAVSLYNLLQHQYVLDSFYVFGFF